MTTFTVLGQPVTQGSKRGIPLRNGRVALVESGGDRLKQWRHAINDEARTHWGEPPLTGPAMVMATFHLVRPASHPKTRRTWPTKRGLDIDKAARAVLDALTGVCFLDDAQVCRLVVTKDWATDGRPGVQITVSELGE